MGFKRRKYKKYMKKWYCGHHKGCAIHHHFKHYYHHHHKSLHHHHCDDSSYSHYSGYDWSHG